MSLSLPLQHRRVCLALLACWLAVARGLIITGGPRRCSRRAAVAARWPAGGVAMTARADGRKTLVVVGGGAAGYFGAIQAAAAASGSLDVFVLEAGRKPLQKVKISGGGRCNVMHDTTKAVSVIAQGYPRGRKQLIGPFKSLFGPTDAAAWFGSRGVRLKTEEDGRMFPVTDNSQTIIDCLEGAARKASVNIITSARVTSVSKVGETLASDSPDADGKNLSMTQQQQQRQQQQQQEQSRFELAFTTATPLPPATRGTLGLVAVAAAAEAAATESKTAASVDGATGSASNNKEPYRIRCDYVLQATGAAREGHSWARRLGHAVSDPVPSLFTLTIKDSRLEGLSGLSVQDAELKLFAEEKPEGGGGAAVGPAGGGGQASTAAAAPGEKGTKKKKKKKRAKRQPAVTQRGPLLITHAGVSGPAALKLSAFGARVLNEGGYRGTLVVNWLAGSNPSKALDDLQACRDRNPKKTVFSFCPLVSGGDGAYSGSASPTLPRRLWQSLALAAGVAAGMTWAELSKAKLSALAQQLTKCELQIVGKGSFKEEFVTCGGVALSALDMRTMQSKSVPGLFFAGEVVDVDGVTGGFNFQSAWTTGWVAGSAIGAAARAAGAAAVDREGVALG